MRNSDHSCGESSFGMKDIRRLTVSTSRKRGERIQVLLKSHCSQADGMAIDLYQWDQDSCIIPIIGKYQIHDHILEQVNCVKLLGIYIDSKLALDTHVDAIVKKAKSTRTFLARNIPRCCRKVKQMAYATYIRPTVEYTSPVWDPRTNKIEMVQHRCARYATDNFDRTSSVTSLLNCLSWPTLKERRRQNRLAVMYRILHNQVDIHWQSFLTKTSSCTRVHSSRLFVPFCKNHVYA